MSGDAKPGPVERAEALQTLVGEAADQAERERRLPQRVADAMAENGLYRVSVAFGGAPGHDPATQIRTIEAISRADGAAGWNLMIGIENFGLLAGGFARGRELFAEPLTTLCSSSAAVGKAERVDGGFRVSGRWPFVSGCHNSRFFAGIVSVHENGKPAEEPGRYALTKREDFEILDTWHVAGLRGSGSHDVRLEEVFVPEEDTLVLGSTGPPNDSEDSPLLRVPTGARLAYNKVGVGLGIARAAIDHFVALASGKVPFMSSTTLRERSFAQRSLALAEARLRSARAFVFESVEELWDAVLAGDPPGREERAILQLACSNAVVACTEAVDLVCEAAGTSAIQKLSPLERCARDVRVVRTHATVAPHHIEDAGRVLLGLEADAIMLKMLG